MKYDVGDTVYHHVITATLRQAIRESKIVEIKNAQYILSMLPPIPGLVKAKNFVKKEEDVFDDIEIAKLFLQSDVANMPRLIDLISVQPMTTPSSSIFYMNYAKKSSP